MPKMTFVKSEEKVAVAVYDPARRKRYYEANKVRMLEYSRVYNLQRKFNITPEQYLEMESKQQGVCSICKKKCSRKLAVDHNHQTNKLRGLLCNSCNRGLGYFKDNLENLQQAINYLKEHN